jgi:hypothetical protein
MSLNTERTPLMSPGQPIDTQARPIDTFFSETAKDHYGEIDIKLSTRRRAKVLIKI